MVYHEKVLHNYFIPCHRKYAYQNFVGNKNAAHGFLYSDCLFFYMAWYIKKPVVIDLAYNECIYYPTLLRRVQITRETSTNITRYLYSSHSPDGAKD